MPIEQHPVPDLTLYVYGESLHDLWRYGEPGVERRRLLGIPRLNPLLPEMPWHNPLNRWGIARARLENSRRWRFRCG